MNLTARMIVDGLYKIYDDSGIAVGYYLEKENFVQAISSTEAYTAHTVEQAIEFMKKVLTST